MSLTHVLAGIKVWFRIHGKCGVVFALGRFGDLNMKKSNMLAASVLVVGMSFASAAFAAPPPPTAEYGSGTPLNLPAAVHTLLGDAASVDAGTNTQGFITQPQAGKYDFYFNINASNSADVNVTTQAIDGFTVELFKNISSPTSLAATSYSDGTTLFSGAPAGALGAANLYTLPSGDTVTYTIGSGHYFVELTTTSAIQSSGNVAVSATPEPAAWSLMIIGIGGIGGVLRTRRRSVAAA